MTSRSSSSMPLRSTVSGERADDAELRPSLGRLLDADSRFLKRRIGEVLLEVLGEALVRAQVHLVDPLVRFEFAEDPVDNRRFADREEHLRSVLRDGPQPRRVPTGEDHSFHTYTD